MNMPLASDKKARKATLDTITGEPSLGLELWGSPRNTSINNLKRYMSIVKAPLPGTIIALMVQPGSKVKREEPILVLEAMKMENNIFAEKAGTVKTVRVAVGDTVMQGDILIEIE